MTRKQMIESENSIHTNNCGDISVEHKGNWYEYDSFTNRYYAMVEPCGFHSKLEREGGMAKKRISKKAFEEIRQAVEDILKTIAEPEAKAETSEQVTAEPEAETQQDETPVFEVGQTYQCSYYKGFDDNGNLLFDKANPNNWSTATVKILKRTKKTVTIESPWSKDKTYKPRTDITLARNDKDELIDVEQCWTYEFRMYANQKVTA